MQQNLIENKFNRTYASLATIQQSGAIEFRIKGLNYLYKNMNNSYLHVLDKIIKTEKTKIDITTAAQINLTFHLMFRKMSVEFNSRI